jgi:hypothetical protein
MVNSGRPMILLDVDGPINPYMAPVCPEGYEEHQLLMFLVWLNSEHGPALLQIAEKSGAELVWATTWEHNANEYIGSRIGLPALPVIEVLTRQKPGPKFSSPGTWKFGPVLEYAAGRPLLWFDDDFARFPEAEEWFLKERAAAGDLDTYLHTVDPSVGLTKKDFDKALSWANKVQGK